MDELRLGVRIDVRGRGELEDRRRELQRVPALPDDPPGARPGRAALPVRRGLGRRDPRRRQLDGRGRDVVHADRPVRPAAVPGPAADDYGMYYGTFQFPNLMLNLHPGRGDGLPRSAARTRPHDGHLRVPTSGPRRSPRPTSRPEPVVELWDLISRQDWAVCERAQTGRRSRALHAAASTRARTASCSTSTSAGAREMGRPTPSADRRLRHACEARTTPLRRAVAPLALHA